MPTNGAESLAGACLLDDRLFLFEADDLELNFVHRGEFERSGKT